MEIDENVLQYLISYAKLDSIDEVLDNIEIMRNKDILNQHPYAITENKDGRYSTYVIDDIKSSKRRKIVKPTREALEKELIRFYKERDEQQSRKNICLRKIYPEWLEYKALHTDSSAYIKTIDELWNKFYYNNSIIDIPLFKLDKKTLDIWAHKLIRDNNMTKKKYYNTTIIMRQALDYAIDSHIIDDNCFNHVKVDSKLFRKPKKKADETQVFLMNEQKLIEQEAYKDFEETQSTSCLAIPFAFQTGLRVSELTSLKWSDIDEEKENYIHIQRMEIVTHTKQSDGTWTNPKRVVVDRTKSDVGNRNVYLSTTARDILKMVHETNIKKGYKDTEYIFVNENGKIHESALNCRLKKYCKNINISKKSMHKIRKTYISTLIDNENININYIREQVGHADERTTYGNYCFNRCPKDLTQAEMERSLTTHSA